MTADLVCKDRHYDLGNFSCNLGVEIIKKQNTMSDSSDNKGPKGGDQFSDKADELLNKGKKLADKAEDFINETANQVKESDAFVKASGFFGKVSDFLDQKSDEFNSGEMGVRFENFKDKTEDQVSEIIKKVRVAGLKIGDAVDEQIEALKGKKDKPGNQNGGGI